MSSAVLKSDPQPIVACTISRDVQIFDLLIEDMESALGENWGDLSFDDAAVYLQQPEAQDLQFVTIAMDHDDEDRIADITHIISVAKSREIKVILITEDVSTAALHQLLREGGDEFIPYPLPEAELARAIERVLTPIEQIPSRPDEEVRLKPTGTHDGVVIPVHGMAGGTGATTFAVNLAWELANVSKTETPRVCLMDLDLQFGTVSTYLDLPRREAVLELLSDTEVVDSEAFMQALLPYEQKIHVLTAPTDMIPLDMITPEDIGRLIGIARANFDYIVIDMPSTMVEWSQTILEAAHVYFAMVELDMRCAQNTLRLKRALQSEDLPFEKLRFALNRAPGFTDLNGKSRVKRLADSLGISIEVLLPDGGKQIGQTNDHGAPLGVALPKNALRKEIAKLAKSLHDVNQADEAAAKV
uniref:AAA family ATPase n=2 Tax=Yoonia sp. TaxID=2212373 RepID=UPI0040480F0F